MADTPSAIRSLFFNPPPDYFPVEGRDQVEGGVLEGPGTDRFTARSEMRQVRTEAEPMGPGNVYRIHITFNCKDIDTKL